MEKWRAEGCDEFLAATFRVPDEFVQEAEFGARYPRKVVGAKQREEVWVPAAELAEFNRHIIGKIEGPKYLSKPAPPDHTPPTA